MTLLDQNQKLIHDEDNVPSEQIRTALVRTGAQCFYAGEDVLYRFNDKGTLFLYSLSRPKFHSVALSRSDLEFFKRDGRVANATAVVRDVGCQRSMVYLEGYSFYVPTELLLR